VDEQEIRTSELRYRRLFEAAQDGILLLDAETGAITDVNPFLIDMLGYSREEFVEKKLWEVGAFKDIEASQEAFEALQKNEYIRYEDLPLRAKDGRLIQVEFVSNVYLVDDEKVIQCNIRDITERAQAQDALLKSEARLREQSVRDHLTGLFNRRYMEETLERELLRASRKQLSLGIIMLTWIISSISTTPGAMPRAMKSCVNWGACCSGRSAERILPAVMAAMNSSLSCRCLTRGDTRARRTDLRTCQTIPPPIRRTKPRSGYPLTRRRSLPGAWRYEHGDLESC
jgi:PAS domain S-box-containing protein